MFAGEPQANRAAQRQAAYMRFLDADRSHEGGDVVGEQFSRIGSVGLVGLAGAAGSGGTAGEMLGIVSDLEGVAGVVGGKVRDEHERLARPPGLVIYRDVGDFY